MSLQSLGWNDHFESAFAPHRAAGLAPARVTREDRDRYLLMDETGEWQATLAGRLQHETHDPTARPTVGDWVVVGPAPGARSVIRAVLPRRSAFIRKVAGETTVGQVLAANVNTAFLVSGLDGDLNLRRIERYLAAAWESGADPVVVLNKADVAGDLAERIAEVESVAPGVPVVALSALAGSGLEALAPWLAPGRTVALLGSSGVGKSTLLNALLGEARQETGDVRADDSRGRHTTTRRELLALEGGGLVIDTPGMRELQLWGGDESLEGAFPEISALAAACRFRDCGHGTEPGCAVRADIERGALDPARLAAWRKLERELKWLATRQDGRARSEAQAKWKAVTKSMRHHPKAGRWKRS